MTDQAQPTTTPPEAVPVLPTLVVVDHSPKPGPLPADVIEARIALDVHPDPDPNAPDILTTGPGPAPGHFIPDKPRATVEVRHAGMAAAAVLFALAGIAIGLYRGGYIGIPGPTVVVATIETPVVVAPAGCLILGDSIAHGLAAMTPLGEQCTESAKIGIDAAAIATLAQASYKGQAVVIISAGSNNPNSKTLWPDLRAIRTTLSNTGSKVIWVLPMHPNARAAAAAIAKDNGDGTVTFLPGGDRVHPRDYNALARDVSAKAGGLLK